MRNIIILTLYCSYIIYNKFVKLNDKFLILNGYFINNKYVMLCFKEQNKNKVKSELIILCYNHMREHGCGL